LFLHLFTMISGWAFIGAIAVYGPVVTLSRRGGSFCTILFLIVLRDVRFIRNIFQTTLRIIGATYLQSSLMLDSCESFLQCYYILEWLIDRGGAQPGFCHCEECCYACVGI
jgi:hypothetical protein